LETLLFFGSLILVCSLAVCTIPTVCSYGLHSTSFWSANYPLPVSRSADYPWPFHCWKSE